MEIKIIDLFKDAWRALSGKWLTAIGIFLIYGIIMGIISSMKHWGGIVSLLVAGPFLVGIATFSLAVVRDEETKFGQLFEGFKKLFVPSLIAGVLYSLAITIGLFLLVVPGIFAIILLSQYSFLLADKKTDDGIEALKMSYNLMKTHKMDYFLLILFVLFLALLSMLTAGLALLVIIPVAWVATAFFYLQVTQSNAAAPKEELPTAEEQ